MKFRLLLLLPMMCLVSSAVARAAEGGRIALYSDASRSQCSLTDTNPGIVDVYVFHSLLQFPAVQAAFALAPSAGFNGTWLQDIVPEGLGAIGTSSSGTYVFSSTCWFNDKLLLHVRYQMQGGSSSCSFLAAVQHPDWPWIVALSCGFTEPMVVDGSRIFVNPDGTCPCEVPVATASTTWGRIKAMYRD